MLKNSQGKVYYGMHFYPGVAEYREEGKDPYRVFINEDTIRKMNPSFAGRPIFVEHVDEVDENMDELRKEADGWVIESFFNSADGKHWVKFIIVSERGERAIKNRMRLSNAYMPTLLSQPGLWNGVEYQAQVTGGEFEHLAIVKNPRYDESVIMTPEEFKRHNDDLVVELKRLSNSQEKGTERMLKLWKRAKVENQADIEGLCVMLPKSGRELTLTELVNEADAAAELKKKNSGNEGLADPSHKVKMHDGSYCNVAELLEKHKSLSDELESMKSKKEDEMEGEHDLEESSEGVDVESSPEMENEDDEEKDKEKKENEESEEDEKSAKAEKKKNELADAAKKKAAKEKADRLRKANARTVDEETQIVHFSQDQVARGKSRYGSAS